MREVPATLIAETISRMCREASTHLGDDMVAAFRSALTREESPLGREVLERLLENAELARRETIPLCQDCGTAVVFLEVGQEVHIQGDLEEAVQEGVRQAYKGGYLRASIVVRPFSARQNTGDNTPAIVHTELVPGDALRIQLLPKGGGAENMSRLSMLSPGDGRQGIVDFVVKAVSEAGSNPCPPVIVGVAVGGTADQVMLLAKKALLRPVGRPNPDPEVAGLEQELLERINALGIGPEGFGGTVTALAVHAEVMSCHIASLPAAVNLQCHSNRYQEARL
ncbi:MAG: fumarate hydratase [Dehalococcoidia bacterium]|jgi:fumarate hydratase subunit alpha|nr:fumarate hydratase [Dehalococcoidia bacterium]